MDSGGSKEPSISLGPGSPQGGEAILGVIKVYGTSSASQSYSHMHMHSFTVLPTLLSHSQVSIALVIHYL